MQRRIEQPNRDRQPVHRPEDADEVLPLQREQDVVGLLLLHLVVREDHLAHRADTLLAEEHVLCPAQADALRATLAGVRRLVGRVRVGTDAEASSGVGDPHQPLERVPDALAARGLVASSRLSSSDSSSGSPHEDVAGEAVDRDDVALLHRGAVGGEGVRRRVDLHGIRAADRRDASPRGHDAACELVLPAEVRMPCDAIMPW